MSSRYPSLSRLRKFQVSATRTVDPHRRGAKRSSSPNFLLACGASSTCHRYAKRLKSFRVLFALRELVASSRHSVQTWNSAAQE